MAHYLGHPTPTTLAATILAKRNAYYGVLEANNKQLEITPWLAWFAATAIEAQRRSIALVDFLIVIRPRANSSETGHISVLAVQRTPGP